jgi:hypothetical protein
MPLPASVPTITVAGTFYRQTGLLAGTPAAGTITFAAPQLRVAADNIILPKQSFTATLDANGSFSVVLLTTTPGYYVGSPHWAYSVTATLTDATFTSNDYQFPEGFAPTVDLADVSPVTDPADCDLVTCANQEEIAVLQGEIEQEIADRIAADDTLQDNIDAEEAAREAANLVLQNEIDAIVGGGIVTSIIAGNGIDVSGATGNVTVSAEFGTGNNQVPQANTVVYLTGNQAIAGNKTFSGTTTLQGTPLIGSANSLNPMQLGGRLATAGPPAAGTWALGDTVEDATGQLWICTTAGTPGTWVSPAALTYAMNFLTSGEEVMPRRWVNSEEQLVADTLHLMYFQARKTEAINNIFTTSGNASSGATLARAGVYSINTSTLAGTLVASTANDVTLWSGGFTPYTPPLTSTFNKVQGNVYAIGYLWRGATPPYVEACAVRYASAGFAPRIMGELGGQTDLPGSFADAALSTSHRNFQSIMLP